MYQPLGKIALLSTTLLAASCASIFNGPQHALTVQEEHPIAVDSQVVTLTLNVDPSTSDLSEVDKARLRAFANAYLTTGHGPLTITAPSGTAEDFDGQETAADIRKALHDAGISWTSLSGATYRTGGDANGNMLIVSYTRYVATPSECGVWKGMRARDYRNLRSPNYGCATQNNIAAMVADPRDLVEPSALSPRDAMASSRAITEYQLGEDTTSETGEIEPQIAEN